MTARAGRAIALLIFTTLLGGCGAAPGPSVATGSSTAPPSPTTDAQTAQPTPAPSLPSLSPSPPPTALRIEWAADDLSGVEPVSSVVDVVRMTDAYILVAELVGAEGSSFAAWRSVDARAWDRVHDFPTDQRILAVTAGGPGVVAGGFDESGPVIWTSVDGRDWIRVRDASLRDGVVGRLITTASGIVGFGWLSDSDLGVIWTSENGLDWLAATNETGLAVARGLQAIGAFDGRAVAIVTDPAGGAPAVWETTGRAEWTRTTRLAERSAQVEQIAGGPRGWVALGSTAGSGSLAWASTDGRRWSNAVSGPDVSAEVVGTDAGFVAVGFVGSLPGETCGDQRPFAGHSWASADGLTWERMPVADAFRTAMVRHLLVVDRTLIGFGQRITGSPDGSSLPVARWTARLVTGGQPAEDSDTPSEPMPCGG